MKKAIYLSAAALLLFFPNISNAQESTDLSPTNVFCSNLSTGSGNALKAIKKMLRSNSISFEEKQVLIKMSKTISRQKTVKDICFVSQA